MSGKSFDGLVVAECPVFYPDTLGLGGNSQHWGKVLGSGGCALSGVQKLEAFCCISSLFLSILKGIVKL